jgi:hypothetical protein
MPRLTIIFLAFLASGGIACLLWHDLLSPTLPPLPPPLHVRQEQFGEETTTGMIAALDRPLPDGLTTGADLSATIQALRDATGLKVFVNWTGIERIGVRRDKPIPARALGGMALGDALLTVCADVHPALKCVADEDDMLLITTSADASRRVVNGVYDVRDLATGSGMMQLEAQLKSHVSPGSWRGDDPDASAVLFSLGGQLVVTATPKTQRELASYLNDLRLRRSRVRFAWRAGALTGSATTTAALVLLGCSLVRSRRRLRNGLCMFCGYDLCMTPQRCPECGTIPQRTVRV